MPYSHFHNGSFHTHHQRPRGGRHHTAVNNRQRPWRIALIILFLVVAIFIGLRQAGYDLHLPFSRTNITEERQKERQAVENAATASTPTIQQPTTFPPTTTTTQQPSLFMPTAISATVPPSGDILDLVLQDTITPAPQVPAVSPTTRPTRKIPSNTVPIIVTSPTLRPTVIIARPTARPTLTATPVPTPTPKPPSTPTPLLPPHLRHLSEKEYMLQLINIERQRVGASPVVLGTNNAAQLHVESALENCFSSHWGMDGLKPNHRYNLAGGYQANGENGHGLDYCIKASERYAPIESIREEIREAMAGWMRSQGHRRTLLDPFYRRVNIGIAWDRYNEAMLQHFEGDYVKYGHSPSLAGGVVSLAGQVKNGVSFTDPTDLGIQVFYDPPPHPLTRGQLSRTYCYDSGLLIASLREPLTGGYDYPSDQGRMTTSTCPDPYDISPDARPAKSVSDALRLWQQAYDAGTTSETTVYQWITANSWTAKGNTFSVKANLSRLLRKHGDGIYSIVVWGKVKGGDEVISKLSFFQGVTPPNTYDPNQWP